ncbi:MAG: VCBS repeat-containing protein [Planctomycetota bacterium]|nr:MAG: VCBS repeat-containing protein [Planctomycetota bacterium]
MQPQWQTYLPLETVSVPLQSQFAPSHVDLNGDGIEDVLTWAMKGTEHWFHALSGSDGSVIWTFVDSRNFGTWDRYAFPAPDLNQDGIRDLLITQPPFRQPTSGMGPDPGNLYAISGVDGSVIWENRTLGYLDPGYGSSTMYRRLNIQFGLPMGDLDRDGTSDVAVVSEEYNFPVDNRFKILLVDGSDGSFTGIWEDFPGDLAPFFPRDRIGWPTRFRLGDTDGDGYVEMAFGVAAHGYVCSSTGLLGKHLVTIGRRTLFAPREIAAGDGFEYHLDVPRGANCRFHLLLSGAFVADDTGFHVGDWDTSLAVGPALSWSQAHPPFHDVLDGNGYATVPMRLPGKAVLAGRSIYARAWIEEPGRPGEVRTMTSLAITRVRPR